MDKSEVLEFVKRMKPRDHVIMFYSKPEDKHLVLFTYLKAGLDLGESAAYIVCEESADQVRETMRRFGIDADRFEKAGALHVINYKDWYFAGGSFHMSKTIELWRKLHEESVAKGFKGLRVTGETECFFKNRMVKELVEYEKACIECLTYLWLPSALTTPIQ